MEAGSRAYSYTRVSTSEQGVSGLGLDAQASAITAYCEQRGWIIVDQSREVASGAKDKPRPVLEGVLDQLAKGDVLIVAKADRLARSLTAYVRLLDLAKRGGWSIVSADGSIDLTTPHGRAMAGMAAVFAELEAEIIGDRTRVAMQAAKARGAVFGHQPLAVDPAVRRDVDRWRAAGDSLRVIADRLNERGVRTATGARWYPATVQRVTEREA